jgi:TonB family protein
LARWSLLLSLSIHVLLGLAVMPLTISSGTHTRPNIIFINIIVEKKTLETKSKPKTVLKKKEEVPAVKKKEEKKAPLPTKLEETMNPPLDVFHEGKRPAEKVKEEKGVEKQENPEKPEPQKPEEINDQNAEKQEKSDAPIQGTKGTSLPLENSPEPGTVPGFRSATWLGEMQALGRKGAAGKNIAEGENSGREAAGTGRSNTSGSSGGKRGRTDLGSYVETARMKIEKAKRYPIEAQRKKWEGRVVLSFQINRHGEVLEIRLIQSSGYRLLDDEGILTLRRASPFPSPLLIEKENLVLEVPIHFKLEKKM